ncbi:MAG: hypothetical protein GY880_23875 [Planctomycetaceae bacterium]|nr:hypothetical protein [Planctomycetaceae bacterium]
MLKKIFINFFLISWLLVLAIDSAPITGQWHQQLKDRLDPYLDVTGLWIGGWQLFAPEPDKVNSYISAEVRFADKKSAFIRSPQWRLMSAPERFISFREAEYFDKIRLDNNAAAWPALCKFWGNTAEHPDGLDIPAKEIILKRHWVVIPEPNQENLLQFPAPPKCNRDYIIYAKELNVEPSQ